MKSPLPNPLINVGFLFMKAGEMGGMGGWGDGRMGRWEDFLNSLSSSTPSALPLKVFDPID